MPNNLNLYEKLIFELLGIALFDTPPQLLINHIVTDKDWLKIYRTAAQQGVQAIVLDGINKVSHIQTPPEKLLLEWIVNSKMIERNYAHQCQVAIELKREFAKEDIEFMVFKGIALAQYYPIPAHREFGDIDLFLFDKHKEGEQLLQKLCKMTALDMSVHSITMYKNVMIENHNAFVSIKRMMGFTERKQKQDELRIDSEIQRLAKEQVAYFEIQNEKFRTLSATANFIYLTYHAAKHLRREIVLRHICDWALFLQKNHDKYDEEMASKVLDNTTFKQMASLMSHLSTQYLGLPNEYIPNWCKEYNNCNLSNKVILNVLRPFPALKHNANSWETLMWKTKRLIKEHWKFRLVYNETKWEHLYKWIWCNITGDKSV